MQAGRAYRSIEVSAEPGETVRVEQAKARQLLVDFPGEWILLGTAAPDTVRLTAGFSILYTVPVGRTFRAERVQFHNYDTLARTVNLAFVPPGETTAIPNRGLNGYSIAAGALVSYEIGERWPEGYSVRASASVTLVVNAKLIGTETDELA